MSDLVRIDCENGRERKTNKADKTDRQGDRQTDRRRESEWASEREGKRERDEGEEKDCVRKSLRERKSAYASERRPAHPFFTNECVCGREKTRSSILHERVCMCQREDPFIHSSRRDVSEKASSSTVFSDVLNRISSWNGRAPLTWCACVRACVRACRKTRPPDLDERP